VSGSNTLNALTTTQEQKEAVNEAVDLLKAAIRRGLVDPAQLESLLSDFVNVGFGREIGAFANALAIEHPTLVGQIAKAVGLGVMRRTLGTAWGPADRTWYESGEANALGFREPQFIVRGRCSGAEGVHPLYGSQMTPTADHPTHDGRLECQTIVGAELMARQALI
jgi:hypothetical protein